MKRDIRKKVNLGKALATGPLRFPQITCGWDLDVSCKRSVRQNII